MPSKLKLRWSEEKAIEIGTNVMRLALADRTLLDPRLPAGALDHLQENLGKLRGESRDATSATAQKTASTADKSQVTATGYSIAHSIREAVKKAHPTDKVLHKALGVGKRLVETEAKGVASALQAIADTQNQHPAELQAAGVLPADLAAASAALAALDVATDTKTGKALTAKQATAAKLQLQKDIEDTIERVVGVAGLAFRTQLEKLATYTALVPAPVKKKAPAKKDPEPTK